MSAGMVISKPFPATLFTKIPVAVFVVLAVGVPLVLTAAGVALGILGFLVGLAVLLIKLAIVVAIIYLIVVGIRAVLK